MMHQKRITLGRDELTLSSSSKFVKIEEEDKCYVYLIKAIDMPGRYKVGITNNIKKRHSQLERQSPSELVILMLVECSYRKRARRLETSLHDKYKRDRVMRRGKWTEWFEFCTDGIAYDKITNWLTVLKDIDSSLLYTNTWINKNYINEY